MASQFNFTEKTNKTLSKATEIAQENSNIEVTPVHVALALLDEGGDDPTSAAALDQTGSTNIFTSVLDKAGADVHLIRRGLQKALVRLPSQDPPPDNLTFSSSLIKVFREAQKIQKQNGDTHISQDTLILALYTDMTLNKILKEGNAAQDRVQDAVRVIRAGRTVDNASAEDAFEALRKYATDMTQLAIEGKLDPVIGRDNEIRRVIRILSRRTKNNPVLIGEPGVGKTAVVEGLAQRIVNRDVPAGLLGKLYSLDMGALMAGAKYRGEYEERIKAVLNEIEKSEVQVLLFIDELHLIMAGQGAQGGGMDAANLIKPMLARGKLRCIGATTLTEYRKYIEKDAAFERRFQQVLVNEPSVPEAISILRGLREKYEAFHGINILDSAIVAACQLAHRYLTSRRLPDSAIDLIDEAASAVRVERETRPERIDQLERKKLQLEVEVHALQKEKDKASKERLKAAQDEIAAIDDELSPLIAQYEAEKHRGDEIQNLRQRIDQMRAKLEDAQRRRDYTQIADLQHYAIPEATERLKKLEEAKKAEDAQAGSDPTNNKDAVTPEAIADIVSKWTGIPVSSLQTTEKEKLLNMERHLSKEVVGQIEAIQAVSNAIRLSRSGLANANRPIASFLFCGSSGTGKTLLTKALAKFLFDTEEAICRIDASEYSEKHSVSRLIGSPPGYVGHEEGGQLTEWVRRKPYSVILIDEIEKAAKEFTTILLQVLDDGRLTDGQGRVVNFKNTVIIMTSNLGSQYLNQVEKEGPISKEVKDLVVAAVQTHFVPEFINRIDSIIVFNKLGRHQVRSIVEIRLREVQQRLEDNGKNIILEVDDPAKDWLATVGYNPQFGARPLNRAIQTELLNPLAKMIIDESIRDGEVARVTCDQRANRLVIVPNHEPSFKMDVDGMDGLDDDVEIEEID